MTTSAHCLPASCCLFNSLDAWLPISIAARPASRSFQEPSRCQGSSLRAFRPSGLRLLTTRVLASEEPDERRGEPFDGVPARAPARDEHVRHHLHAAFGKRVDDVVRGGGSLAKG